MEEQDFMEKVSKVVNFVATVGFVASSVNHFAVQFVEHAPAYAPVVFGVVSGATSPFARFSALLGLLGLKKK